MADTSFLFTEASCFVCNKTQEQLEAGLLLMQCDRCKRAFYCSSACWKVGATQHHQADCNRRGGGGGASFDEHSFPFSIQAWTGQRFSVVLPDNTETTTIGQVKKLIDQQLGLPFDRQQLSFKTRILTDDNNKSLSSILIKPGAVLHVEPVKISVTIKATMDDGDETKTFKREIEPSDTLDQFRASLQDDLRLWPERQAWTFKGKKLKDGTKSLHDHGITSNGATLFCEPYTIPIKIRASGVPVTTEDGDVVLKTIKLKLHVEPTDTIDMVKQKLEEEEDLPNMAQQVLLFDGLELTDPDATLESYGIGKKSVLEVEAKCLNLTVVIVQTGQQITLDEISPSESIANLHLWIADQVSMLEDVASPSITTLQYQGQTLQQGKTLRDYPWIRDGSVLEVLPHQFGLRILCLPSNDVYEIQAEATDTVATLKDLIAQVVDLSPACQRLFYLEEELMDDGLTLDDYNVEQEGAQLLLKPAPIQVVVQTQEGDSIELSELDPLETTLGQIKEAIAQHAGIQVPLQRLYQLELNEHAPIVTTPQRNQLPDDNSLTLYQAKIGDRAVLEVESTSAIIPILVRIKNGRQVTDQFDLDVDPETTTVNALKVMLLKAVMPPPPEEEEDMPVIKPKLDTSCTDSEDDFDMPDTNGMPPLDDVRLISEGKELKTGSRFLSEYHVTTPASILDLVLPADADEYQSLVMLDTDDDDDESSAFSEFSSSGSTPTPMAPLSCGAIPKFTFPLTVLPGANAEEVFLPDIGDPTVCTIYDIKVLLEQDLEIPADKQTLLFRSKELKDKRTVAHYKLKPGTVLDLQTTSIALDIKAWNDNAFTIRVEPDDTLAVVQDLIANHPDSMCLPPQQQRLLHNGKELKKSTISLVDAGIKKYDSLELQPKTLAFTVQSSNNTIIPLLMDPYTTVIDDIRKAVAESHEWQQSAKPPQGDASPLVQRLFFNNKELRNPLRKLIYVGITQGSLLKMEPRPMDMRISIASPRTPGGRKKLVVQPTDTIDALKQRMQDAVGLSPDLQRLTFKGQELQDGSQTLEQAHIQMGSRLELHDASSSSEHHHSTSTAASPPPPPPPRSSSKEESPMMEDRRRKCYMWYSRLGCPTRKLFLSKVEEHGEEWGLTAADVDALPWGASGINLNVLKMNQLFMKNPQEE